MDRVERLCAVLAREGAVCDALARVLRAEHAAVARRRPDVVVFCVDERERLQAELGRVAIVRRALVHEVAAELGGSAGSAADLLPYLPPSPRARVRERLRALRRVLSETRDVERETARLVDGTVDGVSEILRAHHALAPRALDASHSNLVSPLGG
jgi:hypothetical protein